MTVKQVLFQYLDTRLDGLLSGWDLYDIMKPLTGRETYPTTLIRYVKEYADITAASFVCVDRSKSLYFYHRGCGIGAARIEGIE